MTKKEATTKKSGKAKASRKGIAERAHAIIDSPNRYNEETRHAIANMFFKGSKDLAEYVRRAERGEEIFDLVQPLPGNGDAPGDLAEMLSAVLNHPDMPAGLYNAIYDGLNGLTWDGKAVPNIHHIRWCLSCAQKEGGKNV